MPIIRNYNRRIDNSTVVNESDKSQDDPVRSSRKINRKLDLLDQKMDGLYKNIYITRPDNRKNLDDILNQLDDAIDAIQQDNVNISGNINNPFEGLSTEELRQLIDNDK